MGSMFTLGHSLLVFLKATSKISVLSQLLSLRNCCPHRILLQRLLKACWSYVTLPWSILSWLGVRHSLVCLRLIQHMAMRSMLLRFSGVSFAFFFGSVLLLPLASAVLRSHVRLRSVYNSCLAAEWWFGLSLGECSVHRMSLRPKSHHWFCWCLCNLTSHQLN